MNSFSLSKCSTWVKKNITTCELCNEPQATSKSLLHDMNGDRLKHFVRKEHNLCFWCYKTFMSEYSNPHPVYNLETIAIEGSKLLNCDEIPPQFDDDYEYEYSYDAGKEMREFMLMKTYTINSVKTLNAHRWSVNTIIQLHKDRTSYVHLLPFEIVSYLTKYLPSAL